MTLSTRINSDLIEGVGLLLAAAIVLGGLVAPAAAINYRIQLAISVFVATIVLWITKPVPYVISSLLSVIVLYALGLADTFQDAVAGFASSLVFFFVILLVIGQSVAKVDLDSWVADRLVSTTSTPKVSVKRLSTTLLMMAFLMPSAVARTVTFIPVVDQINNTYELAEDSDFRRLSYYILGHVNPMASLVVMTGGGMPIATSEIINSSVRTFTWFEWVVYMTPPIVLLYVIAVAMASIVYTVSDDEESRPEQTPPTTHKPTDGGTADSLTRDQLIVVGTLLVAIVIWIVSSFVGVPAIVPAMAAVFVLALPGVGIITADEIASINWGIVFLIGAMLSLLDVLRDLGAFDVIIDVLFSNALASQTVLVTTFVLFCFAIVIRSFFASVSAALILLLPVLLEFATVLGLNRLYVALSLPIVLCGAVFLPFNAPTVLITYERGPLTRREVLSLGVMTLLFAFLVVAFGWFVYWPALDSVGNAI